MALEYIYDLTHFLEEVMRSIRNIEGLSPASAE